MPDEIRRRIVIDTRQAIDDVNRLADAYERLRRTSQAAQGAASAGSVGGGGSSGGGGGAGGGGAHNNSWPGGGASGGGGRPSHPSQQPNAHGFMGQMREAGDAAYHFGMGAQWAGVPGTGFLFNAGNKIQGADWMIQGFTKVATGMGGLAAGLLVATVGVTAFAAAIVETSHVFSRVVDKMAGTAELNGGRSFAGLVGVAGASGAAGMAERLAIHAGAMSPAEAMLQMGFARGIRPGSILPYGHGANDPFSAIGVPRFTGRGPGNIPIQASPSDMAFGAASRLNALDPNARAMMLGRFQAEDREVIALLARLLRRGESRESIESRGKGRLFGFTEEDVRRADDYRLAQMRLGNELENLGFELGRYAIPFLTEVVHLVGTFVAGLNALIDVLGRITALLPTGLVKNLALSAVPGGAAAGALTGTMTSMGGRGAGHGAASESSEGGSEAHRRRDRDGGGPPGPPPPGAGHGSGTSGVGGLGSYGAPGGHYVQSELGPFYVPGPTRSLALGADTPHSTSSVQSASNAAAAGTRGLQGNIERLFTTMARFNPQLAVLGAVAKAIDLDMRVVNPVTKSFTDVLSALWAKMKSVDVTSWLQAGKTAWDNFTGILGNVALNLQNVATWWSTLLASAVNVVKTIDFATGLNAAAWWVAGVVAPVAQKVIDFVTGLNAAAWWVAGAVAPVAQKVIDFVTGRNWLEWWVTGVVAPIAQKVIDFVTGRNWLEWWVTGVVAPVAEKVINFATGQFADQWWVAGVVAPAARKVIDFATGLFADQWWVQGGFAPAARTVINFIAGQFSDQWWVQGGLAPAARTVINFIAGQFSDQWWVGGGVAPTARKVIDFWAGQFAGDWWVDGVAAPTARKIIDFWAGANAAAWWVGGALAPTAQKFIDFFGGANTTAWWVGGAFAPVAQKIIDFLAGQSNNDWWVTGTRAPDASKRIMPYSDTSTSASEGYNNLGNDWWKKILPYADVNAGPPGGYQAYNTLSNPATKQIIPILGSNASADLQGAIDTLNRPVIRVRLALPSPNAIWWAYPESVRNATPYPNNDNLIYVGAQGALVTRPTWALIGEAGPERVVPLHRSPGSSPLGSSEGGGTAIHVHVQAGDFSDPNHVARMAQIVGQEISKNLRLTGLGGRVI